MSKFLIILGLIYLHQRGFLSESTLRLYDSFAEIHQPYVEPLRFRQSDWENIKEESIRLRSDSENDTSHSFERRIRRINPNIKGQLILYAFKSI